MGPVNANPFMKLDKAEEKVILVDENDNEIGIGGKMEIHREGRLHRAFSIFVFNAKGELLLQQRAKVKYHSGGLWTNTCCGHPRPGESLEDAAHRRLSEEMGFDCQMKRIFSFHYQVRFQNGFVENEHDHVFLGRFSGEPFPAFEEVSDWKWSDPGILRKDLRENPDAYTFWLKFALDNVLDCEVCYDTIE